MENLNEVKINKSLNNLRKRRNLEIQKKKKNRQSYTFLSIYFEVWVQLESFFLCLNQSSWEGKWQSKITVSMQAKKKVLLQP